MQFAEHPEFHQALQLSVQLADAARRIARQYFREPLVVERKADHSPVTLADRAIETEMRGMIRTAFPAHGIQGEEFAAEPGGEFTWVLDPIDGTKSYISGFPLFGSMFARSLLGVYSTREFISNPNPPPEPSPRFRSVVSASYL